MGDSDGRLTGGRMRANLGGMRKAIGLGLLLLLAMASCGRGEDVEGVLPIAEEQSADMATAPDLAGPTDMAIAPDLHRWPPGCGVDGEDCCDTGAKCREEFATTLLYCRPRTLLSEARGKCLPCGIENTPCCVGRDAGGNDGCRPGLGCGTKNGAPTCLVPK